MGKGGLAVKKKGKGTPLVSTNSKRGGVGKGRKVENFVRHRFSLAPFLCDAHDTINQYIQMCSCYNDIIYQ